MHYVATITEFLVAPRRAPRRRRLAENVTPLRSTKVAGAWRNWWDMSVEQPPAPGSYTTRPIGAGGRMVV
jgi:hypothetical protein